MIKLYTNKNLLTPENRSTAHPLIFDLYYFDKTDSSVFDFYKLVDIPEQADVFIYPLDYLYQSAAIPKAEFDTLYQLAVKCAKKIFVFTGGDYGKSFGDPRIISWRNAGFKSSNDQNTVLIPAFISDPLCREDLNEYYHNYKELPQISFTGFSTTSFIEKVRSHITSLKRSTMIMLGKEQADFHPHFNAAGNRSKYLKKLSSSERVITDFILRSKYRAGAQTKTEKELTTTEFYKNMVASPYTFCMRGAGNFSIRFYESLACGRIPVLVDTDVQLPLEFTIPWNNHICRVSHKDDIIEKLIAFHKKFDSHSFLALQESNRNLFTQTLQRHHFYRTLYPELKKLL